VRRLPFALLVLAAGPALAGPASAPAPAPPRTNPWALAAAQQRAERRLQDLVAAAKEDPRVPRIRRYLTWSKDEFANPRRDPTAKLLVAWMTDDTAPTEVRTAARDALMAAAPHTLDPDLSVDGSRGRRAPFSLQNLVPLLVAKGDKGTDDAGRGYVAEVLDNLWHHSTKAIQQYDPKKEATWRPAYDDYRKYLTSR
jgi:hypothetical protein